MVIIISLTTISRENEGKMMSNVYEVMLGKPGGHKQLAFGDDLYKP